uniref:Uncharacterized protein LOC105139443 isoform X2 n=1 Tax=Rhizophora mucronata TaxID=61149 RepID=A0A2P2LQX8_RHIMU
MIMYLTLLCQLNDRVKKDSHSVSTSYLYWEILVFLRKQRLLFIPVSCLFFLFYYLENCIDVNGMYVNCLFGNPLIKLIPFHI